MGTKVRTPAEVVGVECPKKTGEMEKTESCEECPFYLRCLVAVYRAMGAEG